jgi:hypothetical protein
VQLSADGRTWGQPVATGKGAQALTEIQFKEARAKFIRITQTGAQPGKYWSIHELNVLEPPRPKTAQAIAPAKPKIVLE